MVQVPSFVASLQRSARALILGRSRDHKAVSFLGMYFPLSTWLESLPGLA